MSVCYIDIYLPVLRAGSFEDQELQSFQAEIYECSMGMCEITAKVGANDALPTRPINFVKFLQLQQTC